MLLLFLNQGQPRKNMSEKKMSLKVLKVEVKVICYRVLAIFLSKLCLKLIASEASKEIF